MKNTKVIYWIFTLLFAVAMIFSSIGALTGDPRGAEVMNALHYPPYLAVFLSIAKILGVVAILIPGYPRVKEWAYAGLIFDLIGASYSQIASHMPPDGLAFMAVFFILAFGSYFYYHKKMKEEGKPTV